MKDDYFRNNLSKFLLNLTKGLRNINKRKSEKIITKTADSSAF